MESAEKDAEERRMRILGTSTPDLGENVWEDHHACRPEYHDGVVREQQQSCEWGLAEEDPDGEEGDGEEVGEEDEGLLEKACQHQDWLIDTPVLEVAEAATLQGAQFDVWGKSVTVIWGEGSMKVRTVGGKEHVESLRKDVDDGRGLLAHPVEPRQLFQDKLGVS